MTVLFFQLCLFLEWLFRNSHSALTCQTFPKIGELPNLSIGGVGRKNAPNAIGTLPALEPLAVVPEECAKGIGIAFVSLVHGSIIGLDDNNLVASGLLKLFKEPIVEAADFDDCHVATMFSSLFGKGSEKFVNIVRFGTDLSFLDDISVFVSDIHG
jgi:hypothetical protein